MLQFLFSAGTVCLDLFFTAIAYGVSGIHIPLRSAGILSGTGALFFLVSMEVAKGTGLFLPASFCKIASVLLLSALGGAMLLKSFVQPEQARSENTRSDFRSVYFHAERADADGSRTLSAREAFLLSAALSVDSLAVGIGIGWQNYSPLQLAGAAFLLGFGGVLCGTRIGMRLHRKQKRDYSWLSGLCLLLLAVLCFI